MKQYIFLIFLLPGLISEVAGQNTFEEMMDAGYESYSKENYKEAILLFDKAIKINNKEPEAYYLRAVSKSMLNYNEEAIKDFDKAIAINTEYAEAWFERGYSYFLLNNYQKSIEDYSEAIRLEPDYAEAYQNRGSVKCSINDKEGAKQDWQKARELGLEVSFIECE